MEKLSGRTTIISVFTGLGKTTACDLLAHDPRTIVIDLDTAHFKHAVDGRLYKTEVPEGTMTLDDIYRAYADRVVAEYYQCEANRAICGWPNDMAYVILIGAQPQVRQYLSDAGMDFVYLCPTLETLPALTEAVTRRAELVEAEFRNESDKHKNTPWYTGPINAAKFVKSDMAKASVEQTLAGQDLYSGQVETFAIPFGETTPQGAFTSVTSFITDHLVVSDEFLVKNKVSQLTATVLEHVMDKMLVATRHNDAWTSIKRDGNPGKCKVRGWNFSSAMDSYGRYIQISEPVNFWKKYRKHIGEDIPEEYMATMGCIGIDSYVINKGVFDAFMGYLLSPAILTTTKAAVIANGGDEQQFNDLIGHLTGIVSRTIFPIMNNLESDDPEPVTKYQKKQQGRSDAVAEAVDGDESVGENEDDVD